MCIYRNSFGVNAIINSNEICIRHNMKVYILYYLLFIITKVVFH